MFLAEIIWFSLYFLKDGFQFPYFVEIVELITDGKAFEYENWFCGFAKQ